MRERTGSDNSYAKVRFPKSCNIFYSVIGPNEPVLEPEIEVAMNLIWLMKSLLIDTLRSCTSNSGRFRCIEIKG